MPAPSEAARDLLRLTLIPGLGPVLIARLIQAFGAPAAVVGASASDLERTRGIGTARSRAILDAFRDADRALDEELALAEQLGVHIIAASDAEYPPLLTEAESAPPILYVLGQIDPRQADRYPLAIVGSRGCTCYGVEQAERFAGVLGAQGITIVSGGARGIDSAAHRGAMRSGGRTLAVLGCGLAHRYPPENRELFDAILDGRGALVSELPLRTEPKAENFPARNRIISALSMGVLVIEAAAGSGALITAKYAAEDHGREVMALPGRIDSRASEGSHQLLRAGGAALVTTPGEVLEVLESRARHIHAGTHAARYADPARADPSPPASLAEIRSAEAPAPVRPSLSGIESAVLEALQQVSTVPEIIERTGLDPGAVRAAVTRLEIAGRVRRRGDRLDT